MILGCSGLELTAAEAEFFRTERPWGFILFARNISDAEQVRGLVASMRASVDNDHAPVFIDQEGGRVQRIRQPMAPDYPAASELGALYRSDKAAGLRAAWLMSRLHAFDLTSLGITVDCLPVLDVPVSGAHDVIGNRAYGHDPDTVTAMGRAAAEGLLAGGVLPVIKHIPGHGRALVDSHKSLPVVEASAEQLRSADFVPFQALSNLPMAMTAHVIYSALDASQPATTSHRILQDIVRGEMAYDGLIMSDDVSMQALSGDFEARTDAIFAAGCDVVLHCNGVWEEMLAVAGRTPALSGAALERAERALKMGGKLDETVENSAREEFAALVAPAV